MLGELIVKVIPWIIPVFLFCSWLVNSKSPTSSKKGETSAEGKGTVAKDTSTQSTSKQENKAVSDKDMTSP